MEADNTNFFIHLFERGVASGELIDDPAQRKVVSSLQRLGDDLLATGDAPVKPLGWLNNFLPSRVKETSVKGLYIWGTVGRGKTHMVDLFYSSVPIKDKARLHFHRFMELVHDGLSVQGNTADPLVKVADDFAAEARLWVLDELLVADITDAMLLGELFRLLNERGVVLVMTSNIAPDGLYKDGLQRSRFLPAIELIKEQNEVIEVDEGIDYRLRVLEQVDRYLLTDGADTNKKLEEQFYQLSSVELRRKRPEIVINGRQIPVVMWATGTLWGTFEQLCETNRSVSDYIEITQYFGTVILSDVPVLVKERDDAAKRFVKLIDEFYDHGIKLIMSAEVPPEELYQGKRLAFEFQRVVSRIREMQSHDYLEKPRRIQYEMSS